MKLGACDYVVRKGDEAGTFAYAKRLGLAGVELFLGRDALKEGADGATIRRVKSAAAASGLVVPSLCMVEHNSGGVGSADGAVAGAAKEDIRRAIACCGELGAKVILIPFFFGGELPSQAHFDRAVAAFRELCPLAAGRGVALCYEGTFPAGRIREMATAISSEAFGCYLDTANVVWRGMDTATEIRALGKLIRQIHIKDSRVGPGDVQPGLGRVNWAETAKAVAEIGYDGWMVLETPGGVSNPRDISFARATFTGLKSADPWPRFGTFATDFGRGQIDQMIEAFHKFGLSAVQIWGGLLEDCLADGAKAAEYSKKLEQNGTTVVGLAGYRNLTAVDPAIRKANLDHLARCLEVAAAFVNPVVATETGTMNRESEWASSPENWDQPAWDTMCAALDRLLPVAEKNGSVLALEGYVNNILQHVGQVIGLFEKYPTRHLQLVLDPYNYMSSHLLPAAERLTRDFLDRFEHRFVIAHLKDVSKDGAEKDTPAFGKGVFPQRVYAEFLRNRRPDLPIIIEHQPFAEIPETIRAYKRMIE